MAAKPFTYRILIVDDDAVYCKIAQEILPQQGYELSCAEDGFEALSALKHSLPDLIICDLNMPRMSGFELLSVVRRRFPEIPVIAVSGEFTGPELPAGVLADVFLEKGSHSPRELIQTIADLLARSPIRASLVKPEFAPLWIPLNELGYYVVTCTNCLRSFPLPQQDAAPDRRERQIECDHCGSLVRYRFDVGRRQPRSSKPEKVLEPFAG